MAIFWRIEGCAILVIFLKVGVQFEKFFPSNEKQARGAEEALKTTEQ